MRGQAASLMLSIPYNTETGPVPINLAVTNVIITGSATPTTLSNVVIGGALARTAFETTIMNLLPLLGGEIEFSAIAPILSSLYDVQDSTGACSALSVGLSASGVLYTPPAP